jgi:phenylacetate-CoA ligase
MTARALTAADVSAAEILQIHLDPGLANWGRDYKDGAESMEAGVIPLTFLPPEKQLMVLRDYKTSVLITTPSAAVQLGHLLFRYNLNPNALNLKILILVGEVPPPELRKKLEEQLHVKTWVHYGLSEVPGPAMAFECKSGKGLHVSEDHFYAEVIDPVTGEPVEEGKEGELILTSLTTRAFPLIRFRTGDRVRFVQGDCPHGCTLRRIEWFPQRTDELVVLRGVKIHHRQITVLLEKALGFRPPLCRISIKRRDMADFLEIRLAVDDNIFSDEIKGLEKWVQGLGVGLTQDLGVPVVIRLKERSSFDSPEPSAFIEDFR